MSTKDAKQPVERRGYRVNDWCRAFRTSRATAYAMMKDGRLRWVELGGRRFIPTEAAEALVAGEQ
jgi:hypothetical protein